MSRIRFDALPRYVRDNVANKTLFINIMQSTKYKVAPESIEVVPTSDGRSIMLVNKTRWSMWAAFKSARNGDITFKAILKISDNAKTNPLLDQAVASKRS